MFHFSHALLSSHLRACILQKKTTSPSCSSEVRVWQLLLSLWINCFSTIKYFLHFFASKEMCGSFTTVEWVRWLRKIVCMQAMRRLNKWKFFHTFFSIPPALGFWRFFASPSDKFDVMMSDTLPKKSQRAENPRCNWYNQFWLYVQPSPIHSRWLIVGY